MKKQILRILSAVLVLSMILALPVFAERSTDGYTAEVTISGPQYTWVNTPDGPNDPWKTGTIGTISQGSPLFAESTSFANAMTQVFSLIYDANAYDETTGAYLGSEEHTVNYVFMYTELHELVEKALAAVTDASAWSAFVDENTFTADQGSADIIKNLSVTIKNAYDTTKDHTVNFKFLTSAGDEYTVKVVLGRVFHEEILPVSGDKEEVRIVAKVDGTNIIVDEVDFVDEVASANTEIVINAAALAEEPTATKPGSDVTSVTLSQAVIDQIVGNESSLKIKLTDNEVAYSLPVLKAVQNKIEELSLDPTDEITIKQVHEAFNTAVEIEEEAIKEILTPAQQAAVNEKNTDQDIIVVNGYVELFVNGVSQGELTKEDYDLVDDTRIEWTYRYPVSGANAVRVFYLREDGVMEELDKVEYDGKFVTFTIDHLSQYVIEKVIKHYSKPSSGGISLVPVDETEKDLIAQAQVCPRDATCPYDRFPDGDTHAWYHDPMHYCVGNGLIKGITETQLSPNGNITRAQIAMILWRYCGAQYVNYAMDFTDVSGHWAEEAIRWAQSVGVVTGYPDGTFRPNNSITRQEMVAMLYRFAKNMLKYDTSDMADLSSFTDADKVGDWALESFRWSVANNVVNGMTPTTLVPLGTATRAQFAKIIYELVKGSI